MKSPVLRAAAAVRAVPSEPPEADETIGVGDLLEVVTTDRPVGRRRHRHPRPEDPDAGPSSTAPASR